MSAWLKLLGGMVELTLMISREVERRGIIADHEAQQIVKALEKASEIKDKVSRARSSVEHGDVSDDGHKR